MTTKRDEMLAELTKSVRQWAIDNDYELGRGRDDGKIYVKSACPRCGGSGSFSFTPRYGTRCFECDVASGGKRIGWKWEPVERRVRREKRQIAAERKRAAAVAERERADREFMESIDGFVPMDALIESLNALREREQQRKRDALQWIGDAGERLDIWVSVDAIIEFPGYDYYTGREITKTLVKSKTDDGNLVVWYATSYAMFPGDNDERIRIRGTVKDHSMYDGERQTVVNRVKIMDAEKPAETVAIGQSENVKNW